MVRTVSGAIGMFEQYNTLIDNIRITMIVLCKVTNVEQLHDMMKTDISEYGRARIAVTAHNRTSKDMNHRAIVITEMIAQ
jgi:hypothetical protein